MYVFVLCCETLHLPEAFGLSFFFSFPDTVLAVERSGAALHFQVEVEVVLTFVLCIMSRDFSWT